MNIHAEVTTWVNQPHTATSNPYRARTMFVTVLGGRTLESVIAEIIGITEADVRSVAPLVDRYEIEVRTWNRRRFVVAAYDIQMRTRSTT